jgi:Spy/CpxP family protein refolding chaperone
MKNLRLLAVFGVALLTVSAFAQGFGGMRGQGRGGGMMMRGMGGVMPAGMLLMREDVQEELKLSSEQIDKLKDAQEAMQQKMRENFQRGGGRAGGGEPGGGGGGGAMREAMLAIQKESDETIAKILTPEQSKRLKEISLQLSGNRAVMRPEVQKDLGLTPDQVKKIQDLQTKQQEAMRSVMQKARNQEISMEEVGPTMERNEKILNDEIAKVLSQAQRDKLKAMGGAPFTPKETA